nr:immunoglobulin light chain junction region [Macaca mulatta]
CQQGNTYPFTF